MFKLAAVAIATVVATTPVLAEDHDVMADETLSIGGWGKVLNQTVFRSEERRVGKECRP